MQWMKKKNFCPLERLFSIQCLDSRHWHVLGLTFKVLLKPDLHIEVSIMLNEVSIFIISFQIYMDVKNSRSFVES